MILQQAGTNRGKQIQQEGLEGVVTIKNMLSLVEATLVAARMLEIFSGWTLMAVC